MADLATIDRDLAFMKAARDLARAQGDHEQEAICQAYIDQGLDIRLEATRG